MPKLKLKTKGLGRLSLEYILVAAGSYCILVQE